MFTDLYNPEQTSKTVYKAIRKDIFNGQWWFLEIRMATQAIKLDKWVLQQNNFDNPPFCTPGTYGNIYRHFWLPKLEGIVGRMVLASSG